MSYSGIISASRLRAAPSGVTVVAVSDLAVTATTSTTITLGWTTPVGGTNAIDFYKVYVDGSFYENTTDDSNTWTVTGLTTGVEYDIKLITVDVLANESGFSNEVTQSTVNANLFISTWDTRNTSTGSSTASQIKLPLVNIGAIYSSMVVDWGDGNSTPIAAYNDAAATHTYAVQGIYQIKISGAFANIWAFSNTGDKLKILSVQQWGVNALPGTSTSDAFMQGCANLNLSAVGDVLVHNSTVCTSWFRGCTALTTFNRVGEINMSGVITNFGVNQMFRDSPNININLSGWNWSSIKSATSFMLNGGMTTANYDALWISLAGQSLQSNVNAHFGSSKYTLGSAAATARAYVISTYNWTVTDGGGI